MKDRGLSASDFPRIVKLLDNVYAWEDLHVSMGGYTTNSLIVITSDGVLVADGQGTPAASKKLVDKIATLTTQPIKYNVICSDHGDHTNGNVSFPAGVTFIGHPISKQLLETSAKAPNRAPDAPKVIVPTELVADKKVLKMGGTEIQIMHVGKAHAGGDLVVYLPREKVAFTSEIFFNRIFPSMRTAHPSSWIEVLKKVEKMDARIVVPGHGFVDPPQVLKEELVNYRKALEYVVAETTRVHKTGASAEAGFAQAKWGPYESWTSRERNAPIAFNRIYLELDGKLK